jgi:glycolate oxidase iron-sulfur subunit
LSVKSSALSVERSPNPTGVGPLATLDYSVLQQCMHCGMCLPTCPTYVETGRERNSPRGRISLMRAIADGELETTPTFAEEMSYCLGCLACTTACPAGVDYTNLLEHARAHVEQSGVVKSPRRDFVRWLTMKQLFMKPRLLRFAGRLLWLYQASGLQSLARTLRITRLLPASIRVAEPSTPTIQRRFSDSLIAENEKPQKSRSSAPASTPGYRVLLLTGCVQDIAFSDINRATADVLLANNCEVVTPRAQSCCGSLHAHNGELDLARTLARRQLDAVDLTQFDAIISNAAGCGSHLKHYDRLLAEDPAYSVRAAEWSRKLRDISEWLVEIKFRHPQPPAQPHQATAQLRSSSTASAPNHPLSVLRSALSVERSPSTSATASSASQPTPVTYHEACHLCHGQSVSKQPREILRAIPGLELRECSEATWCCGSAGIYSITQPKTASWLRDRKLKNLRNTDAALVAVANPGCTLHLQAGEAHSAQPLEFVHPIVLLARAYAAERGTS